MIRKKETKIQNETITTTLEVIETSPTPNKKYVPHCNNALFVSDITIPDGTALSPGEWFIKTWRMRNIGDCYWTKSYALVFGYGEQMGGKETQIGQIVKPEETVDISIGMLAPKEKGWYAGWWRMKSESGDNFGEFVYVSIQVIN